MRPPARPALLLAAFLSAALPLGAQIPRGPVLEITPAGATSESVTGAAVSARSDDFLLVWTSRPPQGPTRVRFRLFRRDGSPRSPELGVGAPPWDQFGGRIALRADGRFVVVWTENVPGHLRVLGRLFGPSLRPLGPPFRLTPELHGNQHYPDVAWAGGGAFVAVWSSDHLAELPRDAPDIFARRFSAEGRPLGPEFLVNADTYEEQTAPRVAAAGDGDFVVAWESWQGEYGFYDINLQRFASDGSPRGETLLFGAEEETELQQIDVALALAEDGGFIAVCTDFGGDFGRHEVDDEREFFPYMGVVGRRFTAAGTPLGGAVHVNAVAPGRQEDPEVARRPGGFLVVWRSSDTEQRPGGIFARRLRLNGTPAAGGDLRVSAPGAAMWGPVVALNSRGRGVVAWTEAHYDPDDHRVRARYLIP